MNKKLSLLLLIFPLVIPACSGSAEDSSSVDSSSVDSSSVVTEITPTQTPTTPPATFNHELMISDVLNDITVIYKDDCNITGFSFVIGSEEVNNIDIYRGQFDSLNLVLRISYSDDTSKDITLTMKSLSREMRDIINTEGTHVFTLLFRGNTKELAMVVHPSTQRFLVKYLNYDGSDYQTFTVEPGDVIADEDIPPIPNRVDDARFIYLRDKWNVDLSGQDINQDYIIYPEYKNIYKRYSAIHADPLKVSSIPDTIQPWDYRLLYKVATIPEGCYKLYFHMARLTCVPILGYEVTISNVHHHHDIADSQILSQTFYIDDDVANREEALASIWDKGKDYVALDVSGFANDEPGGTGEASSYLNNGQFERVLSNSHDISTILGGHTKTKFTNDDKEYDIYSSYMDTVYEYYYQYAIDHGEPYEAQARIYGNSSFGYYRIALEGDIDFILELSVSKEGTSGVNLLATPVVYMVVDTSTVKAVIDYEEAPKNPSDPLPSFNVAGSSLSIVNRNLFYDSYCALYGDYSL